MVGRRDGKEVYDAAGQGEVRADMLVCEHHEGSDESMEEDGEGDRWR